MVKRWAVCCLLLFSFVGRSLAQSDGQFVIKKDGHYLAHLSVDGTNWVLVDAQSFSPNCLWSSGPTFNPSGTNHNYYFYDGTNYRFLSAPLSPDGTLGLSPSLPTTALLRNTDQIYYFYDWDSDAYGGGVARGHQYAGVTQDECTHSWGGSGECWDVFWVEYDAGNTDTWKLSHESSYNITTNAARFRPVSITEHALELTPESGGLADLTLAQDEMEWSATPHNSQTLSASVSGFSYSYIPAYTTYTFEGTAHNYYGNADHLSEVPGSSSGTGNSVLVYEWSISGAGAEYLSFADGNKVLTSESVSPTLYYRVENTTGHKTATVTLTVTYDSGVKQTSSATVTVKTPCQNPAQASAPVVTYEGVTVSWVSTAEKYKLEWKKTADASWSSTNSVSDITATSYTIPGLAISTPYQYRVTAYCGSSYLEAPSTVTGQFTTKGEPGLLVYGSVFGGGRMADVGGNTEVVIINCDSITAVYGGNDIAGVVGGSGGSTITLGVNSGDSHDYDDDYGTTQAALRIGDVYGGGNGYYAYDGESFVAASYNTTYNLANGASIKAMTKLHTVGDVVWTNNTGSAKTLVCPTIAKTNITVTNDYVKIDTLFGGAKNAILNATSDDVTITVNGGTVFAMFGGNNFGGSLGYKSQEHIVVNNTKVSTGSDYPGGLGRTFGIGTLFGGGNKVMGQNIDITVSGGQIDNLFGGGNAADVRGTTVTVNCAIGEGTANPFGAIYSNAISSYAEGTLTIKTTGYDWNGSGIYNVRTLFGGNNMADMAGLPVLNLTSGSIGTVFGGGNMGDMLAQENSDGNGGTLTINTNDVKYGTHVKVDAPTILIDYLFGGCNMSNVDYSTWVEMKNGHVGTVYGGCDVSGDVGSTRVYPNLVLGENPTQQEKLQYQAVQGAPYVVATGGTVHTAIYAGSNGFYHCNNSMVYIPGHNFVPGHNYVGMAIPTHNETYVIIDGVTVKGNVYAGGNMAYVGFDQTTGASKPYPQFVGLASVRMISGTVEGNVFGGGNRASILGSNEVRISGGSIGGSLYGGNDFSGQAGLMSSRVLPPGYDVASDSHTPLTDVKTYISLTGKPRINTVYGGGNGDYDYEDPNVLFCGDSPDYPIQSNTFVDINIDGDDDNVATRGHINTVYGGGNGVSVSGGITVFLNINNPTQQYDHVDAIFGGNNKGSLGDEGVNNFLPEIVLLNGQVNTVYGGCNQGEMRSKKTVVADGTTYTNVGSMVHLRNSYTAGGTTVNPTAKVTGNIYGGCRSADVSYNTLVLVERGVHTANLFGGCDFSGEADTTRVVVKGGIVGNVYGCGNGDYAYSGTVTPPSTGVSIVDILGGQVGALGNGNARNVYGGGFGQGTTTSGDVIVNIGSASGAPVIYGDVYGGSAFGSVNTGSSDLTQVNIINGMLHGSVYGGGEGETGDYTKGNVYGKVEVNIGACDDNGTPGDLSDDTYSGSATFSSTSRVFGCNNKGGSPQDDVAVNVYHTAHNSDNVFPDDPLNPSLTSPSQLLGELQAPEKFAIQAVYGGGNLANYDPANASNKATVHVYQCAENTIKDVYGGSNAAEASNVHVIVDGGHIDRVFGGGNGENGAPGAPVWGEARTEIHGGLITQVFGGSNQYGVVGSISLSVDKQCNELIYETFSGSNEAPMYGDIVTSLDIDCADTPEDPVDHYFGGSNYSVIYGDVTLNVKGGNYTNVFGGSRGRLDDPDTPEDETCSADIRRFPTEEEVEDHPDDYPNDLIEFLVANPTLYGSGGNVTLNIYGGKIENAYGGSDALGTIYGKITVNVIDTCGCNLELTNVYGGCRIDAYHPNDTTINSPEVNIIHATVLGDVFGGGKGFGANVSANPVVNIGLPETHPDYDPNYSVWVKGDVFGGGEYANVLGSTRVNVNQGTIGEIAYLRKHATSMGQPLDSVRHVTGGNVFGAGKGDQTLGHEEYARVFVNSTVEINGGHVLYNVYGGGQMSSVGKVEEGTPVANTGKATVIIRGGQIGPAPAHIMSVLNPSVDSVNVAIALNGTDGYVFGGGKGYGNDLANNYKDFANVNLAEVRIEMDEWDPANGKYNRIWGSIFGGAEDGHVMGDANTYYVSGLMGTTGTTSYDGNIFGGGRNYSEQNYSAGRVGGNNLVEMTGGTIFGSIFGGGRLGSTGVDVTGQIQLDGPNHGNTTVRIKGGTVGNDALIRDWTATSMGDVFGGGKGTKVALPYPHPAASTLLVSITKNTTVEISQEDPAVPTRILGSVFGGGEMANVGKYGWDQDATGISNIRLVSDGEAKVTISGGTIGIDNMYMSDDLAKNCDIGHVFGGAEGWVEDIENSPVVDKEGNRLIELMATTGNTEVTITDSAFVKGSVYGGSMSGHVLLDTWVKIQGGQIGCGEGYNRPYTEEEFQSASLPECPHWPYADPYDPYDPYLISQNTYPSDGKTWFGNVFGGGSGFYGYIKNNQTNWIRPAGQVRGNTKVEITGGHILSNVYGGCEVSDVLGDSTVVIMSGGTVGVPRLWADIDAKPLTGFVYGSGKGDARVYFNTWTNVNGTRVDVSGGTVFSSVFGGGEEGHVLKDVKLIISEAEGKTTRIGTFGSTGKEGNVFGGGRGILGNAVTAGSVGGNVNLYIRGGSILGSVFGGGRNGSVGTYLVDVFDPSYGQIQANTGVDNDHGYIFVNISGGTIGNLLETTEETKGGNVFGGCMGFATATAMISDNTTSPSTTVPIWRVLGRSKQTQVVISGDDTHIYGDVYGGAREGFVVRTSWNSSTNAFVTEGGDAKVTINGGTIGRMLQTTSAATGNDTIVHVGGCVYGSGRGYDHADKRDAGLVQGNTEVNLVGGHVYFNIYGGGRLASVGMTTDKTVGGRIYHIPVDGTGLASVNMTGGQLGPEPKSDGTEGLNSLDGYVYGGGKGIVKPCASQAELDAYVNTYKWFADVNNTVVTVNMTGDPNENRIWGSVFGGSEDGHVLGDVEVNLISGTVGTHGTTGYDGNIFSGGRNFAELHSIVGRVGGNIVTNMSGGNLLGSLYGGGRQGSVGVDDYGVMQNDETVAGTTIKKGYTNVYITGGVVGHDRTVGEPFIGCNVYGAGKGHSGIQEQAIVKYANVTITDDAVVKGNVFGGGENGHVLGRTFVTIGDATIDGTSYDGSNVVIGDRGYPGEDGNVYGGGRGDGTYTEGGTVHYSPTAGIVGVCTNIEINNGTVRGSVYGGGFLASVGQASLLQQNGNFFTPNDFGHTKVHVTGSATIGSMLYDNGHVYGGGRGNAHIMFDDYTFVHETCVVVDGDAHVNGSVFGGAEDGHLTAFDGIVDVSGIVGPVGAVYCEKNGDTHVFLDENCVIGNASSSSNENYGNVYGGGRGLGTYDNGSGPVSNPNAGIVHGNSHVTISDGTIWRFVFGGGNKSPVSGYKTVNVAGGDITHDVYGGSKQIDGHVSHPGMKTVNFHGGHANNVFGCGFNITDGEVLDPSDPNYESMMQQPTAFVNISGGDIDGSVHGAGQAGLVYGSVVVNIGRNAIYNSPNANTYNTHKDDLYSELNYLNGTNLSGQAHVYTPLHVSASVYGGSCFYESMDNNVEDWTSFNVKGTSNIFIDGQGYTSPNTINIDGNIYGCGTHCESGAMGRNVTVMNYGTRVVDANGWFTGSTHPMGTIQRVDNLVIENSNFTFTGMRAIGKKDDYNLYAVYKVDSCFYVSDGSGITMGSGANTADMDEIKKITSGIVTDGVSFYDYSTPYKLEAAGHWVWIGVREKSFQANRLYYSSGNELNTEEQLSYAQENVLVFNQKSKLYVRYDDNGTEKYGELKGFFRMIGTSYLPWGTESFAYARPKLTTHNTTGVTSGTEENTGDGGFLSYNMVYNFFISTGDWLYDDGGIAHTRTNQYPYTNVVSLSSKGDRTDYRVWLVPEFRGTRWYVDGTRGWGHDYKSMSEQGWGLFPDKPKQTLTGTNGLFAGTYYNNILENFHFKDEITYYATDVYDPLDPTTIIHHAGDIDYDNSTFKDVIYAVGPIDGSLETSGLISPGAGNDVLEIYRYPGGHRLSNGTIDYTFLTFDEQAPQGTETPTVGTGPGPNYGALLNVNSTTSPLSLENVIFDGLFPNTGIDNTYLSIPAGYNQKGAMRPLVVTLPGTTLNLNEGTVLKRGFNGNLATYHTNSDYTFGAGDAPQGGALFVDELATVNMEGQVRVADNFQSTGVNDYIKSNVFLPTFYKTVNISGLLETSSRIGITSPVRSDEDSYTQNTFSPIAVGTRTGTTVVSGDEVANAILDANAAWEHDNFFDDMDGFFGVGDIFTGHSTYHKSDVIHDYAGLVSAADIPKTLFFGWTWNNVVRSKPATGITINKSGDDITSVEISSAEGLAWLISMVNGYNGETKNDLLNVPVTLTNDITGLEKYVWVPIGSEKITTECFAGNFDGKGHLIKGLTIDYIGVGDGRYEFYNYGMFGKTKGATINRTFLVSEHIQPDGEGNMGGFVGMMSSVNGVIMNSEAVVTIEADYQQSSSSCGGLVGLLIDGEIHSSMAMPTIKASVGYLGGLVGSATDPEANTHSDVMLRNSFANAKFDVGSTTNLNVGVGGVIGFTEYAAMANCYSQLQKDASGDVTSVLSDNFGMVSYYNKNAINNCYGETVYKEPNVKYELNVNNSGIIEDCDYYTKVFDADHLGYMYLDNTVTIGGETMPMFVALNDYITSATGFNDPESSSSNPKYARWARPGIPEINGDLPVLMLDNYSAGHKIGGGDFRSLGTYEGGIALQYGGEARDGVGNELDGAIARATAADCLFVYGDITTAPVVTVVASKVSVHEDAAIKTPGSLANFDHTYVGITFDNSSGMAYSSYGMNGPMSGNGPYLLTRDWHMFSSPLRNAPLGFDYHGHNQAESGYNDFDGTPHSDAGHYNNPWYDATTDFTWLNSDGNTCYWLYGWENSQSQNVDHPTLLVTGEHAWQDGYFPSQVGDLGFGKGIPDWTSDYGKFPYGMDLYCWYEPQYHWINFKRNGPNHWHTDPDAGDNHLHIAYQATPTADPNKNEEALVIGKGYMASIAEETFMQSHGNLNAINTSVPVTSNAANCTGWNLIGNPYHAYLDFTKFAEDNASNKAVLSTTDIDDPANPGTTISVPFYVVYSADAYVDGEALESAYLTYPTNGSSGGAYAGRYIHPHQGFYVKAQPSSTPQTLQFNTDMVVSRAELTSASEFRNAPSEEPHYPLVNLFLGSKNGCREVTVVELGRPQWSGAVKMRELRNGNGTFYAVHDGERFAALFAKKETTRIPIHFKAYEDDIFVISWNTANKDFDYMYLVDNLTGKRYDMTTSSSYEFVGHVTDYAARFYIELAPEDDDPEVPDMDDDFAFFDGTQWVVSGHGQLELVDVLGRVLETHTLTGVQSHVSLGNYASGMYLLRLTTNKITRVQKIVIDR